MTVEHVEDSQTQEERDARMEELREFNNTWRQHKQKEARLDKFIELPTKILAFIISVPTVAITAIFSIWCTVIAFTGGFIPLLGWRLEGDFGTFLLWVFIADPIILGIAYLANMLVLMVASVVLTLIAQGVWKVFVRD